jgi:hypothetical protein
MMRSSLLLIALAVSSCGQGTTAAKADRDPAPTPNPALARALVSPSSEPTTAAALAESETPEANPPCPPPLVVTPSALASGWPGLLGQRVRLRVRPIRALSATEWLAVAGGQRFVVVGSSDTSWGVDHVFLVSGASMAFLHGRTSLPELILSDACDT